MQWMQFSVSGTLYLLKGITRKKLNLVSSSHRRCISDVGEEEEKNMNEVHMTIIITVRYHAATIFYSFSFGCASFAQFHIS